ncbi:MAG: glycosyltransferase 87 family protein, partial [Actinomycetota bacterium]|nr:glycosyltransferase 87 family protein [Actinomycetota bacterium]
SADQEVPAAGPYRQARHRQRQPAAAFATPDAHRRALHQSDSAAEPLAVAEPHQEALPDLARLPATAGPYRVGRDLRSALSEIGPSEIPPSETVRATADDPVVLGLSEAIGGPPGRHASIAGHPFWTPVRVVLAMALVVLAAAWVQKAPCRTAGWAHEYQYTHTCYTDVFALYFAEGLDKGEVPYLDHEVEYPVLTGGLMYAVAVVTRAIDQVHPARTFFDLTALLLAASALVSVWALARLHRRRPWDAAMMALAPAMVVTAYVNWDLFAVALATTALLAWARKRLVLAGFLLGLAIAAKFYPLLFLGPMFLLCFRAGRLRAFATTAVVAGLTWWAVNEPIRLAAPRAWGRFFELSKTRGVDWGTFWYGLRHMMGGRSLDANVPPGGSPVLLNIAVALSLIIGCLGIAVLALTAPRRPRLGQLLFLVVAVFLLTGKVWSQQYVLWLIPLAVLARPRWGAFLAWQVCELAYFLAFYYELVGAARAAPVIPEWLFVLVAAGRAAGLLVLCGFVVIDVLRPERDPIRAGGLEDDPIGGVLDGAPDVFTPADGAKDSGRRPVPASGWPEPGAPAG